MNQRGVTTFRILVLDDEPAYLDLFGELLSPVTFSTEPAGDAVAFDVSCCNHGLAAVEMAKTALSENRPYTLAFIDIRVPPGPDGLWVAGQLRALDPNLEIVIMTGFSDYDPGEIAAAVPPVHKLIYIQKPFQLHAVFHMARALCSKWQQEQNLLNAKAALEQQVSSRTCELISANSRLQKEMGERSLAEAAVKQKVQELAALNSLLQSIFDGIPNPLILLEKDFHIRLMNSAAESHFGVSITEAHHKRCYEVFMGETAPCSDCGLSSALERGCGTTVERQDANNPDHFELILFDPVQLESDEKNGVLVRIQDITEGKLFERQVIHSEKLASIGLLTAGIAHEINNPNNFITFNIPVLRRYLYEILPMIEDVAVQSPDFNLFGMSFPEFRGDLFELVDNLARGADRIKATVAALKDFSRIGGAQGKTLAFPGDIIERAVTLCRGQIQKLVKTFEVDVPETLSPIYVDAPAMEQVLVNLLINAAQASDKCDSRVMLSASMGGEDQTHLIIEVRDNGIGMKEDVRKRIFNPFFTTKGPGAGTGLGLYVCHNLIDSLGGRIEVESVPGEGSVFRVILLYAYKSAPE